MMNDVQINAINFDKKVVYKSLKHLCSYIINNPIKIVLFTTTITVIHFLTLGYVSLISVLLASYVSLLLAEENKTNQVFPITIHIFMQFFSKIFWNKLTAIITIVFLVLFNAPFLFDTEQFFTKKFELSHYAHICFSTLFFIIFLEAFFFITKDHFLSEEVWEKIGKTKGGMLFSLGLKGYIISCLGKTTKEEQDNIFFEAYIENVNAIQKYQAVMLILLFVFTLLIETLFPPIITIPLLVVIPLVIGFYQREVFYEMFDTGTKEKETEKSEEFNGKLIEI